MSIKAMTRVFELDIRPSQVKFVLLAVADNANDETYLAFPSVAKIAEKTSQDRKTVIRALDELERRGYLSDTGKRVGKTKQVKVYHLTVPNPEQFRERNGSVDAPETVPSATPKSPVDGTRNRKEPPQEPSGARAARLPAGWTPSELLVAWSKRERPDLDVKKTAEMFRDHWVAVPGRHGCKLDWEATFRNWVRKEKFGPGGTTTAAPKVMKCGNCGVPLGGWTSSEKGPVCNTCHAGYMNGSWPKVKAL